MTMSKRSLAQRSGLLIGLVLLSCYLFYIGKGHTLIIDSNALTIEGKEYAAAETMEVSIDGKAAESMGRAERILVLVGGPRHTISIEVEADGEGKARKVEKTIVLPTFMDAALVSVPAILGEAPAEHWISTFVPVSNEDTPAEQMQHEEEAAPEAAAPPAVKP